jgi:hypothetical protein
MAEHEPAGSALRESHWGTVRLVATRGKGEDLDEYHEAT